MKTSVNIESENVKIASDCNEVYNLHTIDSEIPLVETFCKVQDEYHSLVANEKFASDDSIFFSKCEVLLKRRFLTWFGRDDNERSLIVPKVVGKLFDFIKNSVKMKQKLIILTGHDTTLLPIMMALGIPLEHLPTFCAQIEFEFYENDLIRLCYNGKPTKILNESDTIISLKRFNALTDWILLQ